MKYSVIQYERKIIALTFRLKIAVITTMRFFSSNRSGVEKTSISLIPSARIPLRKAEMFSICLKGIEDLFALIFPNPARAPARVFAIAFIALTSTVPSFNQDAKSPVYAFPESSLIHTAALASAPWSYPAFFFRSNAASRPYAPEAEAEEVLAQDLLSTAVPRELYTPDGDATSFN